MNLADGKVKSHECMLTIIIIVSLVFILLSTFMQDNQLTGPHTEMSSFECGFNNIKSLGSVHFSTSYYIYSIIFLIFDVELCFLLPLLTAMNYISSRLMALVFMIMFLLLYMMELDSGFFEWEL